MLQGNNTSTIFHNTIMNLTRLAVFKDKFDYLRMIVALLFHKTFLVKLIFIHFSGTVFFVLFKHFTSLGYEHGIANMKVQSSDEINCSSVYFSLLKRRLVN